ncbi:ribonucleotide reductase small subunit, partial [Pisolithus tinctorius]
RFILFPIQYPKIWGMYKEAKSSFWTTEDICLVRDRLHWQQELDDDKCLFIYQRLTTSDLPNLTFLAMVNHAVNPEPAKQFCLEVQIAEARSFYGFQTMKENIHCENYSLLMKTFLDCTVPPHTSFENLENIPWLKQKREWTRQHLSPHTSSFSECVITFIAENGIIFMSSFTAVFWLKQHNLLPGLSFAFELTYQDLWLHIQFASHLFSLLQQHPHPCIIEQIINEAVQLELELLSNAIPINTFGINPKLMSEFIQFLANDPLLSLGHSKLYHAVNPFPSLPTSLFHMHQQQVSRESIHLPQCNMQDFSLANL